MRVLITTTLISTDGPAIAVNCPKCGAVGVPASTHETEEKYNLFWVIPLFSTIYTRVSCENCHKSFRIVKPLDEVVALTPEGLSDCLAVSVPFLIKFCITAGIALFWVPAVGFVFSGIGLAATAKKPTGWKKTATIGIVLSLLPIAGLGIAFLSEK